MRLRCGIRRRVASLARSPQRGPDVAGLQTRSEGLEKTDRSPAATAGAHREVGQVSCRRPRQLVRSGPHRDDQDRASFSPSVAKEFVRAVDDATRVRSSQPAVETKADTRRGDGGGVISAIRHGLAQMAAKCLAQRNDAIRGACSLHPRRGYQCGLDTRLCGDPARSDGTSDRLLHGARCIRLDTRNLHIFSSLCDPRRSNPPSPRIFADRAPPMGASASGRLRRVRLCPLLPRNTPKPDCPVHPDHPAQSRAAWTTSPPAPPRQPPQRRSAPPATPPSRPTLPRSNGTSGRNPS